MRNVRRSGTTSYSHYSRVQRSMRPRVSSRRVRALPRELQDMVFNHYRNGLRRRVAASRVRRVNTRRVIRRALR